MRHEKNIEFPLIDIKYFKNKLFLQANLIQLAFQICHFGSIFLVGMYLQVGIGMSAMVAGMIMGMQAIGAICTSRYSVRLFHQFGPGFPIIIGFIGVAILTPSILFIDTPNKVIFGASMLFLRGIFSGLCGTPIQTISMLGFNKADLSRASTVFNAGRQVSISMGIALSSLLIIYGFRSKGLDINQSILNPGRAVFYYAFILIPVVSILGILIALKINTSNVKHLVSYDKLKYQNKD